MNYVRLFLEPVDVWFFRDGLPFTTGENRRARGLFPPTPNTVQGAIRSRVLAAWGGIDALSQREFQGLIGDSQSYGKLRLRGPFLARRQEGSKEESIVRYFPAPADVVVPEGGGPPCRLQVGEWGKVLVNSPDDNDDLCPLCPPEGEFVAAQGWLTEKGLQNYLAGKPFDLVDSSDLFVSDEFRLGIALDYEHKRPGEGMLYQIEFIRPKPGVGLTIDVGLDGYDDVLNALKLPEEGWLSIGGRGRAARFKKVKEVKDQSQQVKERFKLYFATPAYFENGWKPADWGSFFSDRPSLRAAAVRRPQLIGGWDVVKNRAKDMRRYVPAGSVYYFETENPITVQEPVTEDGAEVGFGIIFTGGW